MAANRISHRHRELFKKISVHAALLLRSTEILLKNGQSPFFLIQLFFSVSDNELLKLFCFLDAVYAC